RGDAIARGKPVDIRAQGVDPAPALVAQPAGCGGKFHPVRSRPGTEIGGTDPASFKTDAHLTGAGHGQDMALDPDHAGPRDDGGGHFAQALRSPLPPRLVVRADELVEPALAAVRRLLLVEKAQLAALEDFEELVPGNGCEGLLLFAEVDAEDAPLPSGLHLGRMAVAGLGPSADRVVIRRGL